MAFGTDANSGHEALKGLSNSNLSKIIYLINITALFDIYVHHFLFSLDFSLDKQSCLGFLACKYVLLKNWQYKDTRFVPFFWHIKYLIDAMEMSIIQNETSPPDLYNLR